MSHVLILACDGENCPARFPSALEQAEPGLSFASTRERATAAGWTEAQFATAHFCPACSIGAAGERCAGCGQLIDRDACPQRSKYCSAECAWKAKDASRKEKRLHRQRTPGAIEGRSGACRQETAAKCATALTERCQP